jgi:NAD(P)H-hydrate epimerase
MLAGLPEAMVHGVANAADLRSLARRATVLAVGPGLGQSDWSAAMLAAILDLRLPTVMDADALNLLAADRICRDHWILTPHPGEAGRLLGCSTAEVQVDRYAAVRAIRGRYGGVCVLKGAGTLVDDGQGPIGVCAQGNPGMASGGMGDVLTGVVAGLLAQGLNAGEAARMAVCLHAEAADLAARDGERGLLATDLLPWLRRLVNP